MNKHKEQHKDIYCHNCGYPLHGDENYCPYCRQKNDIRPLSIKNYVQNVLGNFLNFDNRVWQTIIHLLKYPAKVPLDYIRGKRMRYSNPFRFLVQVSILYFLLAGIFDLFHRPNDNFIKISNDTEKSEKDKKIKSDFYKKFDSIDRSMHFTRLLNQPELSNIQKDSIIQSVFNSKILDKPKRHVEFNHGKLSVESFVPQSYLAEYLRDKNVNYIYYPPLYNKEKYEKASVFDKTFQLFGIVDQYPYNTLNEKEIIQHLKLKNNLSNKLAVSISRRLMSLIKNPETRDAYKRAVTSKITLGLFFVLPLFGLFVYLLYYKQGYSYTETLVFIFYLQSVYFFILIIELFFMLLPEGLNYILSMLAEFWFIYFLTSNFIAFYRQKAWVNALKVNLLVIPVYMILTGIGLLIISIISLII